MFKGCGISPPRPRERIIETARELFRRHGFRGIGVEAIAEAAGTNKMTLYRHFGSKDDLIVACLRDVAADADEIWARIEADHPGDAVAQLDDWLRAAAEHAILDGRGCDLANAAVELTEPNHPARELIEQFKTNHHKRLVNLCRQAGIEKAEMLADVLWLLIEGARMSWQSVGTKGPGARFVSISEAVIASFSSTKRIL